MLPHRRPPRARTRTAPPLVPLLPANDPADIAAERDVALYVQEAVTRQMVEDLIDEMREVRDRVTTLFLVVAGGILVDVFTRLQR